MQNHHLGSLKQKFAFVIRVLKSLDFLQNYDCSFNSFFHLCDWILKDTCPNTNTRHIDKSWIDKDSHILLIWQYLCLINSQTWANRHLRIATTNDHHTEIPFGTFIT